MWSLAIGLAVTLAQQFGDSRKKAIILQTTEERRYVDLIGAFALSTAMFAVPIFVILLILRLFLRALIF